MAGSEGRGGLDQGTVREPNQKGNLNSTTNSRPMEGGGVGALNGSMEALVNVGIPQPLV